jgi:regulator of sirC expression with transglutaminase-like and TPR domain
MLFFFQFFYIQNDVKINFYYQFPTQLLLPVTQQSRMITKVNPTNETTEHYVGSRKENVKKIGSPLAKKNHTYLLLGKETAYCQKLIATYAPGAR